MGRRHDDPVAIFMIAALVPVLLLGAAFVSTQRPDSAEPSQEPAAPSTSPDVPALCAQGERLLALRKLDEAEAMFERAGDGCNEASPAPSASGESSGLDRVRQARRDAAARAQAGLEAESAGDETRALAAYHDALAIDAGQPLALARIEALLATPEPSDKPTPSPYAVARQLAAAGLDEAAKESAEEEAKSRAERGEPADYPADLAHLVGNAEPGRTIDRLWSTSPVLAAFLFVLLLAGVFLALIAIRDRRRRGYQRLELGKWQGAADGLGAAIGATIASEIGLLRSQVGGDRLGIVLAPDQSIDIPVELLEAVPQGKQISALWNWTKPGPWTLSGTVLWDARRGAGLSVTLIDPMKVQQEVVIWDDELVGDPRDLSTAASDDFDAAHARLARAAGAWAAFAAAEARGTTDQLRLDAAATWKSYALFRMGAEAVIARDYGRASRWTAMALAADPMNANAAFNAGSLRLVGGVVGSESPTQYIKDADGWFDRVDESLARPNVSRPRPDLLRARLAYNRALTSFETLVGNSTAENWRAALVGAEAAWKALRELRPPNVHVWTTANRDADRLLDMVEDATFALYGGVLARQPGEPVTAPRGVEPPPEPGVAEPPPAPPNAGAASRERLVPRILRTVRLPRFLNRSKQSTRERTSAEQRAAAATLTAGPASQPALSPPASAAPHVGTAPQAAGAQGDAPPSEVKRRRRHREGMLADVGQATTTATSVADRFRSYRSYRLEPRSRYNYACLLFDLAGDAADYSEAFGELRAVFAADLLLVDRAKVDPSLEKVRAAQPGPWANLVPTELHEFGLIGTAWAVKLADHRPDAIKSTADLIAATEPADVIARLATNLGAPQDLVRRWRELARLSSLVNLTAAEVNLLAEARVESVEALRDAPRGTLPDLLRALNDAKALVAVAPTDEQVEAWIDAAARVVPLPGAQTAPVTAPGPGGPPASQSGPSTTPVPAPDLRTTTASPIERASSEERDVTLADRRSGETSADDEREGPR